MNEKNILIVEDDIELNKGLNKALMAEGRRLLSSTTVATAKEQLSRHEIDLIILDINLPDGSGMELLKAIKATYPQAKVILLTANDTDLDIVNGLEEGADDYITKPFSLSVLRARVNTQLRHTANPAKDTAVVVEHFSFDFFQQQFKVHGESVELSKTEQKLLQLLIVNRGNTLSRKQLIDGVWGTREYVDENALSVAMKRLRDKLNASAYIQTVYGIGYRWVRT